MAHTFADWYQIAHVERRIRLVRVESALLWPAIQGRVRLEWAPPLPPDAICLSTSGDWEANVVGFLLASATFAPVPAGEHPPLDLGMCIVHPPEQP